MPAQPRKTAAAKKKTTNSSKSKPDLVVKSPAGPIAFRLRMTLDTLDWLTADNNDDMNELRFMASALGDAASDEDSLKRARSLDVATELKPVFDEFSVAYQRKTGVTLGESDGS